jgi:hypothetical protein
MSPDTIRAEIDAILDDGPAFRERLRAMSSAGYRPASMGEPQIAIGPVLRERKRAHGQERLRAGAQSRRKLPTRVTHDW